VGGARDDALRAQRIRRGYRNGTKMRKLTGPTGPVALTLPRRCSQIWKEWTSRIVPRHHPADAGGERDRARKLDLVYQWFDTWAGLGLVVAGMTHRGWDVQLTACAARDWRANFFRSGSRTPSSAARRGSRVVAAKGKSMPTNVGREDVQRLVAEGAQLVEVLPKEEFDEQHLRGAIHIPLRRIDTGVRASLAPQRPVVVYCWDAA
jgi:hypothetical protein